MSLSAVSLGAAGMVTQALAAQGSAIAANGQDPTSGGVSAQGQAGVQAQFAVSVLKTSLEFQASTAAQLVQMISQGSVDISA